MVITVVYYDKTRNQAGFQTLRKYADFVGSDGHTLEKSVVVNTLLRERGKGIIGAAIDSSFDGQLVVKSERQGDIIANGIRTYIHRDEFTLTKSDFSL